MYNDNIYDKENQTQNEKSDEIEKKEEDKRTKVDELFDNEYEEQKRRKRGKGRHSK